MNTSLKYRSPSFQFLSFMAITAFFFGLSVVVSSLYFKDVTTVLSQSGNTLSANTMSRFKLLQVVTTVGTFVLPALVFAFFSSPRALQYVGLQKKVSPLIIGICCLLLFGLLPFISWLGELNSQVSFGSFQQSLLESEERYNWVLKQFLQMNSPVDLLVNIVIMALLPAMAEELFFRGALFRVLFRLSGKPWMAILISSIIFALLHGTVFKIVPIFTLGLLLGTIYYTSGNLWYSIAIHFLNNAFAVLSVYYSGSSPLIKSFASDSMPVPLYQAALSLVAGILFLRFIMARVNNSTIDKPVTNEVE